MAGVKGRSGGPRPNSGGKRPGAGRKPAKAVKVPESGAETVETPEKEAENTPNGHFDDPLVFLRAVWRGDLDASPTQVRAAASALPFVHKKLGEGGKKEQRQGAAEKVAGRFTQATPPKLVAAGGKKV